MAQFYELTLHSTYYNQRCVNVFNFLLAGTPATVTGSFGLAAAMGLIPSAGVYPIDSLFYDIRGCQMNTVIYTQARIKTPYDVVDFYTQPFPSSVTGINSSGTAVSPATALAVRSSQVRLDIQGGQKRFVGVPESAIDAGGVVSTSFVTALQAICTRLNSPLTYDDEGNTLSYSIVIAKRFTDLDADPPIKNAYFPTLSEQIDNSAVGMVWTPHLQTRTQVTRQYGRGS